MKISILICSKSRRKDLENLVTILNRMATGLIYEIITVEETEKHSPIEGALYISHPVENKGISFARNLGLQHANGDIVVFIDDDCSIHDGWLDNLLALFYDGSVVGVQGGVTVPEGTNIVGWAETLLGFPGGGKKRIIESGGQDHETMEISTLNCAYRRWVLDKIGGFDERLKFGGEDYLLAKKACEHGKCLFVPNALVAHRTRGNLSSIWHWFVRRGQAEVGVVRSREYVSAGWISVLRSSVMIKLLIISLLCLAFPVGLFLVIPLFFFVYSVLQYCRNFSIWRRSMAPLESFIMIPFVKLTMDIATDVGRLKGILHG